MKSGRGGSRVIQKGIERAMSEDGKKWRVWHTLAAPIVARVVGTLLATGFIAMLAIPAVRSWLGGIAVFVYCALSAAAGFVSGQRVERFRNRRKRDAEAEPKWVTKAEAEDLVRGSNYWARLKQRDELYKLKAEFGVSNYSGLQDWEPYDDHVVAITPPRHMRNTRALLKHFWDDHPRARSGDSYREETLVDWLVEQAKEVELPNPYSST